MLVAAEPDIVFKASNKWGDKGATSIRLAACDELTLSSAVCDHPVVASCSPARVPQRTDALTRP